MEKEEYDFMNDFGIHKYIKICKKCNQQISIIQHGDSLPSEALNHIIENAHVKSKYESYHRFLIDCRIDVDLPNNPICN